MHCAIYTNNDKILELFSGEAIQAKHVWMEQTALNIACKGPQNFLRDHKRRGRVKIQLPLSMPSNRGETCLADPCRTSPPLPRSRAARRIADRRQGTSPVESPKSACGSFPTAELLYKARRTRRVHIKSRDVAFTMPRQRELSLRRSFPLVRRHESRVT